MRGMMPALASRNASSASLKIWPIPDAGIRFVTLAIGGAEGRQTSDEGPRRGSRTCRQIRSIPADSGTVGVPGERFGRTGLAPSLSFVWLEPAHAGEMNAGALMDRRDDDHDIA